MLQGAAGRGAPRDGTAGTSGEGGGGGGRDRISDLPDELRHHIFSFMPAWEAVRTSTLSSQWRHIWASARCLDIQYPCGCDDDADQDWYAEFVKHLLLRRRNLPLDTLRLHWNHDDANTWIVHAVRRNARHIELSADQHQPRLKLEYLIFLYGNLKILQLCHLRMNNNPLSQLCSRCTSLEELELKNVDIFATHIRSTSLKRLTMVRCVNRNGFSVDAPNLVLLRCIRPHNFVPGIENSGSLLTASIMLDDNCLQSYHNDCCNCADAEDPGHSESQPASDDNMSDDEDLGDNESQSEPDDDSSAGSEPEDLGGNESQSESDDDSSAGSDSEDLDNNNDDGEMADVYSGEDHSYSADSDAEEPDISDDDDEDEDDDIENMYLSEDDGGDSGSPIYGGHGILRSLFSVITMNLSAHYGQLLLRNEVENNCPEFRNLRTLSLGEWCTDPGSYSLSTMLGNSPNLENLFIRLPATGNPTERTFTCNNLRVKISYSISDGTKAHQLENFLRTNYGSREKRKAQGEAGNREKRKAQGEAGKSPAKQRKVRKSRSPEGGQCGN